MTSSDEFERRKSVPLTDEQIEEIAEAAAEKAVQKMTTEIAEAAAEKAVQKMTTDIYAAIGKGVTRKFLVLLGAVVVGLWLFLNGK